MALLAEVGIESLSLRRLAGTLGVTTPTLYWHFAGKQELIDAMAVSAMSAMQVPQDAGVDGVDWVEWLRCLARESRRAMLAHRDGALLISLSRPSSRQWADVEGAIGLLAAAGFTPRQSMIALGTTAVYVVGCVLDEQQRSDATEAFTGINVAASPLIGQAIQGGINPEDRFEDGLEVIVRGVGTFLT